MVVGFMLDNEDGLWVADEAPYYRSDQFDSSRQLEEHNTLVDMAFIDLQFGKMIPTHGLQGLLSMITVIAGKCIKIYIQKLEWVARPDGACSLHHNKITSLRQYAGVT